jgi:pSer/pThr/pTyr-binding forkhead associated (FHA) protein
LVFNDLTVSRTHAYLFVVYEEKEVKVEICDASHKGGRGSANGVFISGRSQRLESHEKIRLRDGSSITLGKCKLKLKIKKFA